MPLLTAGIYADHLRNEPVGAPSGIKEIRGAFGVGDCVRCVDLNDQEFARGLVNYSAQELNQIKGLHTSKIEKILGYKAYDEIIHRDDLVVL